ncbi:MAG: F0F1 ATP synthase subunit epsilon [Methylococcales bacterium]|jgi:F-type H+-transporting ATPase subunit epsilon|nr:F0F1 ATP synthase subunit epsilon [Methylococcales bacterium]
MVMTVHVDIVSAERQIFSGLAEMVVAPAEMGEVGIYPRHSPMITRLKAGEIRIVEAGGTEQAIYVSGGILEVQPNTITVLSDTAQRCQDLDESAAIEAKEKAEKLLADNTSSIDYARAKLELAEAIAQLRAIDRLRKKR